MNVTVNGLHLHLKCLTFALSHARTHTHTDCVCRAAEERRCGQSSMLKETWTCGREEPRTKLPTLRLVDDPLHLLSHYLCSTVSVDKRTQAGFILDSIGPVAENSWLLIELLSNKSNVLKAVQITNVAFYAVFGRVTLLYWGMCSSSERYFHTK